MSDKMDRFRKIFLWCVIFAFFGASFSDASDDSNVMKLAGDYKKEHTKSLLKYNNDQVQRNITDEDYLAYDLGIVVEAIEKLNRSKCGQDAMTVMMAITRRERWAIKMFDASSKFPVGLLYGNFYQLGNFDECVNLQQPLTTTEDKSIHGQYCLADVEFLGKKIDGRVARSFEPVQKKLRHSFNNTMHWSICVPSSCTVEEVKIVIKEIFLLATNRKNITIRLTSDKCHVNRNQPLSSLEIVYGCLTGAFSVCIVLATVFHYYILQQQNTKKTLLKEFVLCFSLKKNIAKFLSTKSSDLNLNCICGIKFISMMLIIAGHTCLFLIGGPVQNTEFYEEESTNLANAIFVNSPLLVDTFLLVGGFLLCYLLLIELEKRKGRLNIFVLCIARYIRLTPSYLVVLGFYCTYLFRIADGPLWDSRIKMEQERCQKSWWTNLLYINNYVNTKYMCMFQSWYLAADYHLFIISLFIIFALYKWSKIGKVILGLSIFAGIFTPFVITLKDKLDPTLMVFAPEIYDVSQNFYFKTAYIKTHMRSGSYFLGLFFGYILYKLQTKGVKIPQFVLWFGWLLSTLCAIISMYSVVIFYNASHEYNSIESAIYASFHRVAWCISIGWILIVCITKNASVVDGFLSWKPFIPLSRLTYCAYLINGFVEIYSFGSIRAGNYMSKHTMGTKCLAHMVFTFSFAFVLCILFESPIHSLEKILLSINGTKEKNNTDGNNSEMVNGNVS